MATVNAASARTDAVKPGAASAFMQSDWLKCIGNATSGSCRGMRGLCHRFNELEAVHELSEDRWAGELSRYRAGRFRGLWNLSTLMNSHEDCPKSGER